MRCNVGKKNPIKSKWYRTPRILGEKRMCKSPSILKKREYLCYKIYMLITALMCIIYSFFHQGGTKRVHLLDGTIGGVLLKELFQRDGVGTMVAR